MKMKRKNRSIDIEGELSLSIKREDNCFVAYCPDLELSTHGETLEEARQHFNEVLEIFWEEVVNMGTLEQILSELGWEKAGKKTTKWFPPACVARENISLHKTLTVAA